MTQCLGNQKLGKTGVSFSQLGVFGGKETKLLRWWCGGGGRMKLVPGLATHKGCIHQCVTSTTVDPPSSIRLLCPGQERTLLKTQKY